jgi:predicted glycosyltransferase
MKKVEGKVTRKNPRQKAAWAGKIWIDLDNSPHVPFFNPIIRELEERGYEVMVTARDCFQVCGLADLFKLKYKSIGRHYGKNKILKVIGTLIRSFQLLLFAVKGRPTIALSHGSRAQLLTASMLRIPTVELSDYEYAKGVGIAEPDWVIGPEVIPDSAVSVPPGRILRYPGLKEDVYVPEFEPDPTILRELGISNGELLVTIRPPATEAHYHNPKSERFFVEVVNFLGSHEEVRMVILPRNNRKQTEWVERTWPEWLAKGKIVIPDHVVDGLNLIWHSALVVSGGGTMNREAAALGVPVYSIFQGKIGAVDQYLSETGRLVLLQSVDDIPKKIVVSPRNYPTNQSKMDKVTCNTIIEHIEAIMASDRPGK